MDPEEVKESTTDDLLDKDLEESDKEEHKEEKEDMPEFGPIKKPTTYDFGQNTSLRQSSNNKSGVKTIILIILLLVVVIGVGYLIIKSRGSMKTASPVSTSTTSPTPAPTEAPKPKLNKSDWSFEVLNGSGQTGLAKKIGDQIKGLGYEVTKTGNADKDTYVKTQIFVKSSLVDKVEMVIADLKDVIKIASFGGELKDSTSSARIIIGKDNI